MHRLTNLLLYIFAIVTIVVMIVFGQPGSTDWWLRALGFIAWISLPYAILWVLNNIVIREEFKRDVLLLMTTMLVCVYAGWRLLGVFQGDPSTTLRDTRLAEMFMVAPIWQSLAAVAGGILAFLMPGKKKALS